jgi:hypothetical protein
MTLSKEELMMHSELTRAMVIQDKGIVESLKVALSSAQEVLKISVGYDDPPMKHIAEKAEAQISNLTKHLTDAQKDLDRSEKTHALTKEVAERGAVTSDDFRKLVEINADAVIPVPDGVPEELIMKLIAIAALGMK